MIYRGVSVYSVTFVRAASRLRIDENCTFSTSETSSSARSDGREIRERRLVDVRAFLGWFRSVLAISDASSLRETLTVLRTGVDLSAMDR